MALPYLKRIDDDERRKHVLSLYSSLYQSYLDNAKLTTFFGGQPVSMMPESLLHITEKRREDDEFLYNITAKLDGTRMLLFLHPLLNSNAVFIDRSMSFYEPILEYIYSYNSICLFDGEMYEHVFFVFDMLYYNGYLCDYNFETRLSTLQELLVCNRDRFTDLVISYFTNSTKIHIVPKLYMEFKGFKDLTETTDLYTFVTNYFTNNPLLSTLGLKFPLSFDGLIFTPRFTRYILADNWKYPSNILYKWKPVKHETIDFILEKRLVRTASSSKRSKKLTIGIVEGYKKQRIAFQTDTKTNTYAIVTHDPSVIIDSSRVYECGYDNVRKHFYVIRERSDKTNRPNTIRTANSVWKLLVYSININSIMPLVLGKIKFTLIECIPDWQKQSSELITVIPIRDSVINRFNRQNGTKGFVNEFEIRIGICKHTFFDAQIRYQHYKWLMQTLDSLGVEYNYNETVDVFDTDGLRTTYGSTVSCVHKYKQDIKDYTVNSMFGYDFRISVCTEEYAFSDAMKNNIGLDEHKKLPNVTFRTKKRRTYLFSQNFRIDMTEVHASKSPNTTVYQVEIELKEFRYFIDIEELNRVVLFVLRNLFGKSELL